MVIPVRTSWSCHSSLRCKAFEPQENSLCLGFSNLFLSQGFSEPFLLFCLSFLVIPHIQDLSSLYTICCVPEFSPDTNGFFKEWKRWVCHTIWGISWNNLLQLVLKIDFDWLYFWSCLYAYICMLETMKTCLHSSVTIQRCLDATYFLGISLFLILSSLNNNSNCLLIISLTSFITCLCLALLQRPLFLGKGAGSGRNSNFWHLFPRFDRLAQ